MARGPAPFTEADVKRILKGAKAAGVPVRIEYAAGKIAVIALTDSAPEPESQVGQEANDFDGAT